MKKEFVKPVVEVVSFEHNDIITCSGGSVPDDNPGCHGGEHGHGGWFWPWPWFWPNH